MDLLTYLLTVARYDKSIGCFGVVTVNMFLSVNIMMLTSLGEIF